MNEVSARPNTRAKDIGVTFDKNWQRCQGWNRFTYSIFLFIEYNIPIRMDKVVFKVGAKPLIYVRSQDGDVEQIISEEQLKSIKFEGYVE